MCISAYTNRFPLSKRAISLVTTLFILPRIDGHEEKLYNKSWRGSMGQRKKFGKAFKRQVILRVLAEESTASETARELGVHYSTVIWTG